MRKLPQITIERAHIEDLPDLLAVADSYFEQGSYDAHGYDRDVMQKTMSVFLMDDEQAGFKAKHGDKIVGYYGVCFVKTFTVRPIMYEVHFAVMPEYAKTSAGRDLTKAVIEYGKKISAVAFYAGVTSGIKRFDQTMQNMYHKQGLQSCGVMMRYLYE